MDVPDEFMKNSTLNDSYSDSLMIDTSNLSFSTQVYDDHRTDSSSSLDEQHDFDELPDNELNEKKYVSNKQSTSDFSNYDREKDDNEMAGTSDGVSKMLSMPQPHKWQTPPKRKCILDVFPWLSDVTQMNQECLGSIIDIKNTKVLDTMDFLIRKLLEDYHDYYKSPKLAVVLSRYIRRFLYVYRHLYQSFELGKDYFKRISRILAIYTDLELCSSVLGLELDADTANRIVLLYRTYLKFADQYVILDVFLNMRRLCRGHRGILNLLLQYYLVKITVLEPVELPDDLFIKYLIIFKKWLAVEEVMDDKENIRNAFVTQVKPQKTLCMNISYAPYLPADEEGSATIDNYIRMLDKKYSLEPLIRALEMSEKNSMTYEELPNGIVRQISEVVVLSDDEDEPPKNQAPSGIKIEPIENQNETTINSKPVEAVIDLTDEAYDEADVPRHYVSWLTDLVARAKIKPVTVGQRLEVATISNEVIVIDDDDISKPSNDVNVPHEDNNTNASVHSKVNHVDSPSSDSGCVIMNREEVGTHSNNNFEMSQSSSDTGVEEEEVVQDAVVCENTGGVTDDGIISKLTDDGIISNVTAASNNVEMDNTATTGSNSSCSELAAEQLLTVTSQNKVDDILATDNLEKDKECRSPDGRSTSEDNAPITSNIEIPNIQNEAVALHSPSTVEPPNKTLLVRQTSLLRTSRDNTDNLLADEETPKSDDTGKTTETETEQRGEGEVADDSAFLSDIFAAGPVRSSSKDSSGTTTTKNIEEQATNPVQQTASSTSSNASTANSLSSDWFKDDNDVVSDLGNYTHYPLKRIPGSFPSSAIRLANSLLKSTSLNEHFRRLDQAHRGFGLRDPETEEEHEDEDEDEGQSSFRKFIGLGNHGDNNRVKILKNVSKSSPVQPHERSVRFADELIDTIENDDSFTTNNRRRPQGKIDVPNLEGAVPSTIKDRKTYIKSSASSKHNKIYAQSGSNSFTILPTSKSPPPSLHNSSGSHDSPRTPASHHHHHHHQQQQPQQQQQQQHHQSAYRVFYSGTEIDLGMNEVVNPLSDCNNKDVELRNLASPNLLQSSSSSFCESDNNLMTNPTFKPSLISSKLNTRENSSVKVTEKLSTFLTTTDYQTNVDRTTRDDLSDTSDKLTTISSNSEDESEAELQRRKREYMFQIYKELGDHLKTLGFKPEDAFSCGATKEKRLMDVASKFLETKDIYGEEIDEGDASLPFKKRRKLPGYIEKTIFKEEDSDSQPPFESPLHIPIPSEVEITSTSAPSPPHRNIVEETTPIARMECLSYPPTPMLSIANIVEYLPIRAYSTFKTPTPLKEMAPVRFNLVPQQTMVINNTPNATVIAPASSAAGNIPSNSGTQQPQHMEIGTTFNIIPPQQGINSATAPAPSNTNINCNIVTTDSDPYIAPIQTIASDGTPGTFNVASNASIQYHQTFHPNPPYTTTYSLQPAHQPANSIPPNFDLQNMFNLSNYQMSPQNYHNLVQNSRINLQEKQAILLNDFMHSFDNPSYDNNTSQHQQQQVVPQQQAQQQQQHQQSLPTSNQPQFQLPQQYQPHQPTQMHIQIQPQRQHQHQTPQIRQPQQHIQQQQIQQNMQPMQQQQPHLQIQIQPSQQSMPVSHAKICVNTPSTSDHKVSTCNLNTTSTNRNTSALRTKAARKMVTDTAGTPAQMEDTRHMQMQTNRVTRSSNRTTRSQHVMNENKSPRRKTSRFK